MGTTPKAFTNQGPNPPQKEITDVLAKLRGLDRTGRVEYDSPRYPVARGGYGEVYKGRYRNPDGSDAERRVAIKVLRTYLDGSFDTRKVSTKHLRKSSCDQSLIPRTRYTSPSPDVLEGD